MVVQHPRKVKGEDYVDEIKQLILDRFPDAEFKVYRRNRKDFRVHVVTEFESMFDILDLTSERTSDILVDHDIWITVSPFRRSELSET